MGCYVLNDMWEAGVCTQFWILSKASGDIEVCRSDVWGMQNVLPRPKETYDHV